MKYLFDLDSGQLTLTRGGASVSKQEAVSGAQSATSIAFYRGAEPVKQPFNSMWFGFVTDDDEVIALTEDWTYNTATMAYEGVFSTNTDEVDTALGASDSITVYAQLIWKVNAEDVPTNSQVIEVTLRKSVLGFDATTPLGLETPAVWLATTLAALTGKTTPVDADSFAITDSAASSVLKKLTFANLKTWIQGFVSDAVDIVDNLVSTDPAKVLSANQGRVLDEAKVDKEDGKGLSTNDFDDAADEHLSGLPTGAELSDLIGNKASVESLNALVPLAIHGASNPLPSGLQISGTISTDYAWLDALLFDLMRPSGEDANGPTWSSDGGIPDGSAEGERVGIVPLGALPSVWQIVGISEGVTYAVFQTTGDVSSPELGTWEPVNVDSSGTPTVSIYSTTLKAGQMSTSDDEPDVLLFATGDDRQARTPRINAEGYLPVAGVIPRSVAEAQWDTDIPAPGENVNVGDTGCTCVGDGARTVTELPWSGLYVINATSAWVTANKIPTTNTVPSSVFRGARDVEVIFTESVPQSTFSFDNMGEVDSVRRRSVVFRTPVGVTLANQVTVAFAFNATMISGGTYNSAAHDPSYIFDSSIVGSFAFEVYLGEAAPAAEGSRALGVLVLFEQNGQWTPKP